MSCVDLEKFFDRVNHDVLMSRLARRIEDRRMLRLIRRYLEAGVMQEYLPGCSRYFAFADTANVFGELDKWLRHRLRWRNSALYLQSVLMTRYFDELGVPRLRPVTPT